MEAKECHVSNRALALSLILGSYRMSCVCNIDKTMLFAYLFDPVMLNRLTCIINRYNCLGLIGNVSLNTIRINVVCLRVNICKNRSCADINSTVCGSCKCKRSCNNLISLVNSGCNHRTMKCCRSVTYNNSIFSACNFAYLLLNSINRWSTGNKISL